MSVLNSKPREQRQTVGGIVDGFPVLLPCVTVPDRRDFQYVTRSLAGDVAKHAYILSSVARPHSKLPAHSKHRAKHPQASRGYIQLTGH